MSENNNYLHFIINYNEFQLNSIELMMTFNFEMSRL